MDWIVISLIVGCSMLSLGLSIASSLVIGYILFLRLKSNNNHTLMLRERIQSIEEALEIEEQRVSAEMSARGKRGVEVREQNKEMRQAAMSEGRALLASLKPDILTNPETQAQAKARLVQLTMRYPKAAEEVFEALSREFHIEEPFKSLAKTVITQTLLSPKTPMETDEGALWYGD